MKRFVWARDYAGRRFLNLRLGPLYVEFDHINPEYEYRRCLHVEIGRLVFSIGIAG